MPPAAASVPPPHAAPLDLVVVGAGPAGRALAHRAGRAGLRVALVDPAPERIWTMTIGVFADDLPGWLCRSVVTAAADDFVVYTPRRRSISRGYCVIDAGLLQRSLSLDAVHVVADAARSVTGQTVRTMTGTVLNARYVVDARGGHTHASTGAPHQRAVGSFVPIDSPEPEMVLMDWRRPTTDAPTFSYRVTVGDGRELIEETSLAAAPPGIEFAVLAERNLRRCGSRGGDASELVDFPLYPSHRPWRRPSGAAVRFGAAGGQMNPATGYSIADSLRCADSIVTALCGAGDLDAALWPWRAKLTYLLRMIGLSVLLALDGPRLVSFFDAFFTLPPRIQRAYLSDRSDPIGTLRAMLGTFAAAPLPLKLDLIVASASGLVGVFSR